MYVMFFDTETTGRPINYKAPMTKLDNWPRVIQLGWQMVDYDTEEVLTEHGYLITPDGWAIPKEKFWIDHGYSTEKNEVEGHEMPGVLDKFIKDLAQCEMMVAHNISFDYPVLGAEMIRYGKKLGRRVKQFCTMNASTDVCQLPGKYGNYKWPKLEELFKHLFDNEMTGAHDAGSDVTACRLCYFEMVNKGIIECHAL